MPIRVRQITFKSPYCQEAVIKFHRLTIIGTDSSIGEVDKSDPEAVVVEAVVDSRIEGPEEVDD